MDESCRSGTRGLWVRGRLNLKVQRGRELLALLESGGLDGLSIGFKTVRARNDRAVRHAAIVGGRFMGNLARHLPDVGRCASEHGEKRGTGPRRRLLQPSARESP